MVIFTAINPAPVQREDTRQNKIGIIALTCQQFLSTDHINRVTEITGDGPNPFFQPIPGSRPGHLTQRNLAQAFKAETPRLFCRPKYAARQPGDNKQLL